MMEFKYDRNEHLKGNDAPNLFLQWVVAQRDWLSAYSTPASFATLATFFSKAMAMLIDLIAEFFDFQNTLGDMIIGLPNTFAQAFVASTK